MQQLKTTNQVVKTRDRQISKGIVVAMSCEILKINEETYRVQSEKAVDRFYVVRFSRGEPNYCTCKNWEIVSQRDSNHICKHMRSIIYASVHGLIIEQDPQRPEIQPHHHTSNNKEEENRLPTSWKSEQYGY